MNEEKQIEEMRKDLIEIFDEEYEKRRLITPDFTAEKMTAKGYCKQSDKDSSKGCEYCKGRAYTKKPLTVITKYGRRIELVFEFCPNCGRKMKGGAG